jgi:hypothetical protein
VVVFDREREMTRRDDETSIEFFASDSCEELLRVDLVAACDIRNKAGRDRSDIGNCTTSNKAERD